MSLPSSPNNRKEVYLSNIAGQGTALPTAPQDREEMYLDYIAKNGGGGGGTGDGDMKKSIYDSDLAVASAGGIKSYVSGAIADKVDKVQGKGLSTNDYDDTAKEIVDGVSTALDGKVSKSNTAGLLKNDGTVDTTTYATSTSVSAILDGTTIDSFGDVESALADKAAASDVSTIQGLIPSSATTSNKLATASDIQEIEGNPSGSATAGDLTKLKIDNDIFSIPSGGSSGTTVVPNPSGTATADLNKVQIGTDIYSIPQTDISGKADKVSSPTSGDFASLDSNGNLTDSGKKASDFASSAIMDGQSIDSFGDVESALADKVDKVSGKGLSTNDYTNADKDAVSNIPTVSVTHTGTASSTGVRKQQITVNNVSYDVDGSAYMEQSVTLSTSQSTDVVFTNAIIADGTELTFSSSIWDLVPDDMVTTTGVCTVTLPKWTSAVTIGCRLRVR